MQSPSDIQLSQTERDRDTRIMTHNLENNQYHDDNDDNDDDNSDDNQPQSVLLNEELIIAANGNDNNHNNNDQHHESSLDEMLSVIDDGGDDDTEPTIIDAWHAFIRQCRCCLCCCKCQCCSIEEELSLSLEYKKDSNWEFDDEVEKAMNEKKRKQLNHHPKNDSIFSIVEPRDLRTALIDQHDHDNLYEISRSKSKSNSKSKLMSNKRKSKKYKKLTKHAGGARMRCYCIPCLKWKPMIWQLTSISICIQLLVILTMGIIEQTHENDKHHMFRIFAQIIIGCFWFIQLMVMIQLILTCIKKLWQLKFYEIIQLYLTSLLIFTGVYASAYFFDNDDHDAIRDWQAFNLEDTEFSDTSFGERIVAFFYFSCSQQTLCGVCEIIPKSPPTMFLAGTQMLFGIFFSIIITSIGISRLGEDIQERYHRIEIEQKKLKKFQKNMKGRSLSAAYDNLLPEARTCWNRFRDHSNVMRFRRTTRKYLLLIVIVIQTTKNLLEYMTSDSTFANQHDTLHSLLFIIFDVVNIAVVTMTSLKFVHIGHMTELRLSFLCQTYLSSMLIFTGIYVDIQVSSSADSDVGAFDVGETEYMKMWTKFTYFSFAMMTLCGAGLDVKPRLWYSCLAVCIEMLLGLFFHVYIFGIGLLLLATKKYNTSSKQTRIKNTSMESPSIIGSETNTQMMVGSQLIMSTLLQN